MLYLYLHLHLHGYVHPQRWSYHNVVLFNMPLEIYIYIYTVSTPEIYFKIEMCVTFLLILKIILKYYEFTKLNITDRTSQGPQARTFWYSKNWLESEQPGLLS
jgi:hypothetical protein